MTTTDYLIDGILVLIVLRQIRWKRLDLANLLLPLALVAGAAAYYIKSVPIAGHDVGLYVVLGAVGALFGAGCALGTHVRPGADGTPEARAGVVAAALWVIGMGGRMAFAIAADHGAGAAIASFSRDNAITSADAWVAGLVIMALAQVVVRLAGVRLKAHRVGRTGRAVVAA